jgi:hypothetical protein
MKTFVPVISLPGTGKAYTLRHNQNQLQLLPGAHEYSIRFGRKPEWWLEKMNTSITKLSKETFGKLVTFDTQFNLGGSDYRLDQPQKVICPVYDTRLLFLRSLFDIRKRFHFRCAQTRDVLYGFSQITIARFVETLERCKILFVSHEEHDECIVEGK